MTSPAMAVTGRSPSIGSASDSSTPGARLDRVLDVAIVTGLTVLILVGFVTSYRTLRDLAEAAGDYPGWLAPAVPLSFDLGLVVLSLKVVRAAREGRTAVVLRSLVVALSAATVTANASASVGATAAVLHAVPPAMFVVCFESVVVSARRRALDERGLYPSPLPRQRGSRWLLAPRATWTAWRAAVLADDVTTTRTVSRHDEPVVARRLSSEASTSRRPPRPTARPSPPRRNDALKVQRSRAALVHDTVEADPAVAAPALREILRAAGHDVSLRTAQRLRRSVDTTLEAKALRPVGESW